MSGVIDKNSIVAMYQQIADELKKQVLTGKLKVGDRIMTESEISQAYDVSRITVRKAIEILVEDGILVKKQGKGTFVAQKRLTRNGTAFMGFSENCERDGKTPGTKLLSASLEEATASDERNLDLQEGERVIVIRRVRYMDGVPVILEENHFPQKKYAFLLGENLERSLYVILKEHGILTYGGKRRVSVCRANGEEAKYLDVEEGEALILMKDVCVDPDGFVIHSCKSLICPDRYELVINTAPEYLS